MSEAVAGIVLAAGLGSRFGAVPKMLAEFQGEALVRRAARAALEGGLSPALVVTGHRAEEVEAALAGLPIRIVYNPAFREGMATSLQAGFAALPADAAGALVLLGDMPGIGPGLVRTLADEWVRAGRPSALVPLHDGRRGNPVLLSRKLEAEIGALSGDRGAGPLLRDRPDVHLFELRDPAVLFDVDAPEALERFAAGHRTD